MKDSPRDNISFDALMDLWDSDMDGLQRFQFIRKYYPDKRTSYEQLKLFAQERFERLRAVAQLDHLSEVELGYFLCIKELVELIDAIDFARSRYQS